jgi:rubrerythrin
VGPARSAHYRQDPDYLDRSGHAGSNTRRLSKQTDKLDTEQRNKTNNKEEVSVAQLKGTKTEENLKTAFAGESQANRRYLYFAQKADVEGYPDVAALFRSVAEGETGHAFGHFDFLREVGDPVTGVPVGKTEDNLKSAIEGETYEYTEMYPGFSRTARDEGLEDVAEWLETLARAEKSHAGRFSEGLKSLKEN